MADYLKSIALLIAAGSICYYLAFVLPDKYNREQWLVERTIQKREYCHKWAREEANGVRFKAVEAYELRFKMCLREQGASN